MGRTPSPGRVPELLRVPGAAPVLLGCTLFAVYCCVPETSHLPWVAMAVAVLAALEYGGHALMPWWTASVAVLVAWSGWHGGQYRSSALVGAAFAWWPWLLVGAVHLLARVAGGRASARAGAVSAAAGVVAAVGVARTGALARTLTPALLAVAIAAVATLPVVAGALAAEHAVWHRLHPRLRPGAAAGDRESGRVVGREVGRVVGRDDAAGDARAADRAGGRVARRAVPHGDVRDAGMVGSAADDAGEGGGRDQQAPVDVD